MTPRLPQWWLRKTPLSAVAKPTTPDPIVRNVDADQCTCPNDHPHLDEFIARNVNIHFEAMGDAQFWIGVTLPDGRMWHINCGAKNMRAVGYAFAEEDS